MRRVIDFLGGVDIHGTPLCSAVPFVARTHGVQFIDMVHGAESTLFIDEHGRLMVRRIGNLWYWPPLDQQHRGAILYAPGELVVLQDADRGEPVDRRSGRFEDRFQILHCGTRPEYLGNLSLREAGASATRVAYRCVVCRQEFSIADTINTNTPAGQALINALHDDEK